MQSHPQRGTQHHREGGQRPFDPSTEVGTLYTTLQSKVICRWCNFYSPKAHPPSHPCPESPKSPDSVE